MTRRVPIFIGGCPRSGTTALTKLLNAHRRVLVGNERYYLRLKEGELAAEHFERDRFLTIEPGDVHPNDPGLEFGARAHWAGTDPHAKWDEARLVGDKYPPIWRAYPLLKARFAKAHVVYVLRNPLSVAESYQARFEDGDDHWPFDFARGVRDWNESVVATEAAVLEGMRITVVAGEAMFEPHAVEALFRALGLGLDFAAPIDGLIEEASAVQRKPVPRDETIRQHVCRHADFGRYRALMSRAISSAHEGDRRAA